jgi:pSer/pThr/pTyr-binding forkhead associated (FHA) protein
VIPNIVFIALRYLFIGLLFLFLVFLVRAIYRDVNVTEVTGKAPRRKKKDMPHLVVVTADRNIGAKYYLVDEVRIGRSSNSNIVIDDTYASQQHARVFDSNGSFHVEDLGSTNGTYVNGRKISYPLELRQGDRIKIGKTVFEFRPG